MIILQNYNNFPFLPFTYFNKSDYIYFIVLQSFLELLLIIISNLINSILENLLYKKLKKELYHINLYNKFKIIYNVIFSFVINF